MVPGINENDYKNMRNAIMSKNKKMKLSDYYLEKGNISKIICAIQNQS